MSSILSGSLRAGKQRKDSQSACDMLSKVVELNGKYRIFMRKFTMDDLQDLYAATVPGRTLDLKVCGATFIPYTQDMYEINPDTNEIIDKTCLQAWSRIARVLFNAQALREKKAAEAEANSSAEALGVPIDQIQLNKKLEAIELTYYGGEAADGTKIAPKQKPFVSALQLKITNQIAVVKLNADGKPDFKNSKYACYEFSNQKLSEIINLLDDPNYCDPNSEWIELGYDYIGADKAAAGRAASFKGIAHELTLAVAYPELWEAQGKAFVEGIVVGNDFNSTAEMMRNKNRNLRSRVTVGDIITSIKKWCASNQAIFTNIDYEDSSTISAAADFLENNLVESLPKIKSKFEEAVSKSRKTGDTDAGTDDVTTATDNAETSTATTTNEQALGQVLNTSTERATREAVSTGVELDDELGELE